jgi:gamma-glutamyltranspeptidase/glutathione hydrolase
MNVRGYALAFGSFVLIHFCAAEIGWPADPAATTAFPTRAPAVGQHGMAATSQPLASQAALEVMKAGGNAVDAAIAANAVLAVTEPMSCGPGGDLFAIVWDAKTSKLYGLNASGRSPQSLTLEEFQRRKLRYVPTLGPLSITVPGCVDGWCRLHERFGKLPLDQVLAPAIRAARDGFPVTQVIARSWALGSAKRDRFPGFDETYRPAGHAPAHGEVFRNEPLAETLEQIARGGRDAFYRDEMAHRIADAVHAAGGFLSAEDLAAHHSDWVEPLSVKYRGYDVWELPPNGQGLAVLEMLQILEGYDLKSMGFGSADYLHTFLEAKKLAYEDRARYYADQAFYNTPIAGLLDPAYAAQRRGLIDPKHARAHYSAGNPALEHGDTIYLTTADRDRNMVSPIQSNYHSFGSSVCVKELGFCLQNRGALFDLTPGRPNSYSPGKRPFHTIIPAFVTKEGRPVMSFGVMGGDMQPQGQVQVLVNLLEFDMGLQEAGDAPRVHHTGTSEPTGEPADAEGGEVACEASLPAKTLRELDRLGHHLKPAISPSEFGGYQAIWYDANKDVYFGATERRKDGIALGY